MVLAEPAPGDTAHLLIFQSMGEGSPKFLTEWVLLTELPLSRTPLPQARGMTKPCGETAYTATASVDSVYNMNPSFLMSGADHLQTAFLLRLFLWRLAKPVQLCT